MRLLVTRPDEDASATIAALERRGHEAIVAPLLVIRPLIEAVIPARKWQAILITSANGARAVGRHLDFETLKSTLVLAVGPASAEAAREVGFVSVASAGGNVETLEALVASRLDPEAGPVLHVAGKITAGDLKGGLEARGFCFVRAVLYEAQVVAQLPAVAREALEGGRIDGVLLYSPRTATTFADLVRKAELLPTLTSVTAYCLSAAVAKALQGLSFGDIKVSDEPSEDALLSLIGN